MSRSITELLHAWNEGDPAAFDELTALVYEELRRIARAYVAKEKSEVTLQPTDLVHEAWLRFKQQRHGNVKERRHFYGVAAKVMRRVLMDRARRRNACIHGGTCMRVTLSDRNGPSEEFNCDFLALDEALESLKKLDPRQVDIVELRFLAGLSVEETAKHLQVSPATVKREMNSAKAFLLRELNRH